MLDVLNEMRFSLAQFFGQDWWLHRKVQFDCARPRFGAPPLQQTRSHVEFARAPPSLTPFCADVQKLEPNPKQKNPKQILPNLNPKPKKLNRFYINPNPKQKNLKQLLDKP